ncbi:hypothetical protein H6B11_15900 [Mediterraneibacter glycyrrhizinilyticus]|nr:hypothetical protein [Mediterraneibacter glycyrrhizinilyticus]MBM6855605.1 hypothetical protein [Mediterraneibacter glycyrrhizinilyticus]
MKKFLKWFSLIALAGTAVGLVIAYFCKSGAGESTEDDVFTEDEDFDLDVDLKPASDREYVSLSREGSSSSEKETDAKETDTAEEVQD